MLPAVKVCGVVDASPSVGKGGGSTSSAKEPRGSRSVSALSLLRGHETAALASIAGFAGVASGRALQLLRKVREAVTVFTALLLARS